MSKGAMILKTIDFKNGILAKPINDNFSELHEAIRQERLNTGGYGVSYGLDSTIDGLTISFKEGHVIDKDGYSYNIKPITLNCNAPSLKNITETCEVMYDGTIFLKNAPYGANGKSEISTSDVIVKIGAQTIQVASIQEYTVKISRDYAYKTVTVNYNYAEGRIDSIVVNNNALQIIEGIPSKSPSIRPQSVGFCVACVLIDPYLTKDTNGYYCAGLAKVHEQEHLRNVYTNSDNELYLNGIKASQLGFIYFEKPDMPAPNKLWYDEKTHQIYTYLSNEWVAIDNKSMTPVSEFKLYIPEENPADSQTFLFHKTKDMNVRFMAGQNELSIIIDQYPLFRDQFVEITYKDALQDEALKKQLPLYGYSFNETFDNAYENMGIGFKLTEALKAPSYVEAKTVHRVVDANLHSRHQRSASFIHTGFVDLEPGQTTFTTSVPYRYDENQIEIKTSDKNLFEYYDYTEVGVNRGDLSREIELRRVFGYGQRIHYRITTNVYSYDHIASLIEELKDK